MIDAVTKKVFIEAYGRCCEYAGIDKRDFMLIFGNTALDYRSISDVSTNILRAKCIKYLSIV